MVVYTSNLSSSLSLVSRLIEYFKQNQDKELILKEILNDTQINYSRMKVLLTFLIKYNIIIKKYSTKNIKIYYYNKEFNRLENGL